MAVMIRFSISVHQLYVYSNAPVLVYTYVSVWVPITLYYRGSIRSTNIIY